MNATSRNWLTTVLFAGLGGFAMYLLAHMPDGDAGWGPWRIAIISAACTGMVLAAGAYHAYRPQSGKGDGGGDNGAGAGSSAGSAADRTTPPNATHRRALRALRERLWVEAVTHYRRCELGVIVGLLAVAGAGCAGGQLNPQVLNVSTLTVKTLACTLDVYSRDSQTSPINWTAMALDFATSCGLDVAAIVNAFGPDSPVSKAAVANAEAVNLAAARKAAKDAQKDAPK